MWGEEYVVSKQQDLQYGKKIISRRSLVGLATSYSEMANKNMPEDLQS